MELFKIKESDLKKCLNPFTQVNDFYYRAVDLNRPMSDKVLIPLLRSMIFTWDNVGTIVNLSGYVLIPLLRSMIFT